MKSNNFSDPGSDTDTAEFSTGHVSTESFSMNYTQVDFSLDADAKDIAYEVEQGEPPTPKPDPGDAEGQELIYGHSASDDYFDPSARDATEQGGGGDFILVDLVGSSASDIDAADTFVFELEPSGEPNEPTRPDPGDAEGQELIFGHSASDDYFDPSASGDTSGAPDDGGGIDIILFDIVDGFADQQIEVFDDFLFG